MKRNNKQESEAPKPTVIEDQLRLDKLNLILKIIELERELSFHRQQTITAQRDALAKSVEERQPGTPKVI